MTTPDEAVKALAEYARLQREQQDVAQEGTPRLRELVDELYQSDWHVGWEQVHPVSKYAPNKDPRNKSRFYAYLKHTGADLGLEIGTARNVYHLVESARIANLLVSEGLDSVKTLPEGTLRPLSWYMRNRYADRAPEVFRRAVALAGSADRVTSQHVREASQQYKAEVLTPKGVRQAQRKSKAERDLMAARAAVERLGENGSAEHWNKLIDFMETRSKQVFGE